MNLPSAFEEKMSQLLGKEYDSFIHTYHHEKASGMRVNTLKLSPEDLQQRINLPVERIPFCPIGFYYPSDLQLGKHPYHLSGLFYIQEPSAMYVAQTLDPKPHERVLDLCAAPGGKSTQLAALMKNKGLLISNEIHPKRVKALSENIERLGISNSIVTNEIPEKLAQAFPGFFDKILVDAPCSGEGMFRKDEEAIEFWSEDHVKHCSAQQKRILDEAYTMLKQGGILVYSTCTFSPEENEQVIEAFLQKYPDMELLPIDKHNGVKDGRPEWTKNQQEQIRRTARLWPHHLKGEGHFVAKLRKTGETVSSKRKSVSSNLTKAQTQLYRLFEQEVLNTSISGILYVTKTHLYSLPERCPSLDGLKVIRPGLHLGEFKKNRFEPNHALAMALRPEEAKHFFTFGQTDEAWKKYIRGETIQSGEDRGWLLLALDGFSLGWGKETKGTIKNFYPKGLRLPNI
ncbi:RsmB/NOP family class I SAM-dependent RNA methyltransferase [Bacillus songklensis]|uniref:RsmB/NOP family class I SAM-dependent RNA methyltransferase n=1 Tax=Bacillus songklensis TaxID=1069116 RepID=A0ABV8B7S0_9BACI